MAKGRTTTEPVDRFGSLPTMGGRTGLPSSLTRVKRRRRVASDAGTACGSECLHRARHKNLQGETANEPSIEGPADSDCSDATVLGTGNRKLEPLHSWPGEREPLATGKGDGTEVSVFAAEDDSMHLHPLRRALHLCADSELRRPALPDGDDGNLAAGRAPEHLPSPFRRPR